MRFENTLTRGATAGSLTEGEGPPAPFLQPCTACSSCANCFFFNLLFVLVLHQVAGRVHSIFFLAHFPLSCLLFWCLARVVLSNVILGERLLQNTSLYPFLFILPSTCTPKIAAGWLMAVQMTIYGSLLLDDVRTHKNGDMEALENCRPINLLFVMQCVNLTIDALDFERPSKQAGFEMAILTRNDFRRIGAMERLWERGLRPILD